jgi:prepilin-type processing-associated H-X9-DG protein
MGGRNVQNTAQLTAPGSGNTGRHTDGSNFAFLDGHVKWLRGSQVSNGYINNSPNCDQGYVLDTNGGCTAIDSSAAAGTAVGKWAGTFSDL